MTKEKQIKNIVHFFHASPENTLAHHRVIGPARHLGLNVISGFNEGKIDVESITKGEIVVIQRDFPRHQKEYQRIISLAREEKKPVVLDLDDLLFELPEEHPDRKRLIYSEGLLPTLQAIREADMITVATPPLQEYIQQFNRNVRVLPNYLDDTLWTLREPIINPDQDRPIKIGYMGGDSHEPDLRMISPILLELIKRYPSKLQFTFWGITPPAELGETARVNHIQLQIYEYPKFVSRFQNETADIFIAPLVDNFFNSCKSAIKFLEYSARGIPGVYSNLPPYSSAMENGHDGYLATTQEEWLDSLSTLIENPQLRVEIASNAQKTIRRKWLLSKNAHLWLEAYQETLGGKSPKRLDRSIFTTLKSITTQVGEFNTRREQQVQALIAQADERVQHVQTLLAQEEEREQQVQSLTAQVDEREQQVQALTVQVDEAEQQVQALTAQVDDWEQQVQALTVEVDEADQQVKALTAQMTEQEQQEQALMSQLREISVSKAWRVAMLLRRTRIFMLPPGGWRVRLAEKKLSFLRSPPVDRGNDKIEKDLRLIRKSGYFDRELYLSQNPDVAQAGVDPLRHYLLFGGVEGRDPGPNFVGKWYMRTYPDVKTAGINPLVHYLRFGKREGRAAKQQELASSKKITWKWNFKYPAGLAHLRSRFSSVWRQEGARGVLRRLQRFLPKRIKKMIPYGVRKAVSRRLSAFQEGTRIVGRVSPRPERLSPFKSWQIYNGPNRLRRRMLKDALSSTQDGPNFSVIMPVFDPPLDVLNKAIESVLDQSYERFELIIIDDYSSDPNVRSVLEHWASRDERVKALFRSENGHISAATNTGAEVANGDFLVFVDNDDEIPQDALAHFALYIRSHPEVDILYSDDAKLDGAGPSLVSPKFKPDWSPELLLSYCYISHLNAIRTSLFREVGGCRIGFEGSQDHDLLLRASEKARHVGHIPQILYHRRVLPTSTSSSGHAKPYSFEAGRRAVEEAFRRRGVSCQVEHPDWAFQAGVGIYVPKMPDTGPSVAIVIPTKNNKNTLEQLIGSLNRTTYKNYKVYIVDNSSDEIDTVDYLSKQPHKVIKVPNPGIDFNFAHLINEAVKQLSEDFVLFLNDDTAVKSPTWLSQMVGWLQLQGVGAVGARLLFPDGRVQHAGVALPLGNVITAFKGLPGTEPGYLWSAKVSRNCSAVTAAAMLTRRTLFLELGGFNKEKFAVAYNDVEYCLRLQDADYRVVYCGEAELYHHGGQSRGRDLDKPDELVALKKVRRGRKDPFFSPHLARDSTFYEIKPTVVPPCRLDRPLRVLLATHNLNHEGAPNSALELVLGLRKRNAIDPVIVSPQDGPLRAAFEAEGVPVEIISETSITPAVKDLSDYESRILAFGEAINLASFDLVCANTALMFWAIDAAERLKVPSVWIIRESEPWQSYYDGWPREVASRALQCFAIPYRVVFVANSTRSRWSPVDVMQNFHVINNGLDLKSFDEKTRSPERTDARRALELAHDELCVLSLGTVCSRKGQKDLLLALYRLPEDVATKLSVFIVGGRENTYTKSLQNLMEQAPPHLLNRIHIVQETGDTAVYWNAADMFCCTSYLESYPRIILEAMAKSLPIITTPVFGIKEQVREGMNALLFDPGDIETLADCLDQLVSDSKLRSRFASNSRLIILGLTNNEEMLDEYEDVYASAALSYSSMGPYSNPRAIETRTAVKAPAGNYTNQQFVGRNVPRLRWSRTTGNTSILAMIPRLPNGYPDSPSYIRVVRPLQHKSLTNVLKLSLVGDERDSLGQNHNALLIQRDAVRSLNQVEELLAYCHEKKIRLIYEIDDNLFELPDTHPSSTRYSSPIKEVMKSIAQSADAVVVSTTPLQERMMQFNKNVYILPNALDENLWHAEDNFRQKPNPSDEVRILYMGTRTHDDDLALVIDSIKRLKEEYGERVSFTSIGGFIKSPPDPVRILDVPKWAHSYPEFAKWMANSCHFDIAIAPLVDNEFNRHKSYIKYLDYGICGFAQVLSNVRPYHEIVRHRENGMLVENTPESWYEALNTLIEDQGLRHHLGQNSRADVLANHTLKAQVELRREVWNQILSQAGE